jgi:uncharacterized protein (DUF4415 family)
MGYDGDGKDGRNKVPVKLLLDPETLKRAQTHGPDWQQRLNELLRAALLKSSDEDGD